MSFIIRAKMETNHQTQLFQAMAKPEFYPHMVSTVEPRETHISKVFSNSDDKSFINSEEIDDEKSILIQCSIVSDVHPGVESGFVFSFNEGCHHETGV